MSKTAMRLRTFIVLILPSHGERRHHRLAGPVYNDREDNDANAVRKRDVCAAATAAEFCARSLDVARRVDRLTGKEPT